MGKQELTRIYETSPVTVELVYANDVCVYVTNGYSFLTETNVADTKKLIEALKKEVNSLF